MEKKQHDSEKTKYPEPELEPAILVMKRGSKPWVPWRMSILEVV